MNAMRDTAPLALSRLSFDQSVRGEEGLARRRFEECLGRHGGRLFGKVVRNDENADADKKKDEKKEQDDARHTSFFSTDRRNQL